MGVRPNLVLGAIGAAVFLLTASVIAANWRGLTGTQDYAADVQTSLRSLTLPPGHVNDGQATNVQARVTHANVTSLYARVTWHDDPGLLGEPYEVTVTLRNPQGVAVASGSAAGGQNGVTLQHALREAPRDSTFSATEAGLEAKVEKRYPSHPEDIGAWTLSLHTDARGRGGIDYDPIEFRYQFYNVTVTQRPEIVLTK